MLTETETKNKTILKFSLLTKGMRISPSAYEQIIYYKNPIRTRSGVSGGLDIILPHNIYVNVPVQEEYTKLSPYSLDFIDGSFLIKHNNKETLSTAILLPIPAYYAKRTQDDTEDMVRIGQMCSGDRFCYGMTGSGCAFWNPQKRCKYCSIGKNHNADASRKKAQHLIEVLKEAIADPHHPAKHILLGGGTPNGDDMGAVLAAELCEKIKTQIDIKVYVMIAAPLKNQYIDLLFNTGVDELGMNLEFWSDEAWKKYIPGKNAEIGKQRYLDALDYAVSKFGPINTRTIFIAGLEDKEETIKGATQVASMGIMPIISPFRPLKGAMLEDGQGFDAHTYYEIFETISNNISQYKIPPGPTCKCCQNNTLALPFGKQYRFY